MADGDEFWVGSSLPRLSHDDMAEIQEELAEGQTQARGFGSIRDTVLPALGLWRARAGGNLRVGVRSGEAFHGLAGGPAQTGTAITGPVNVVMERLMMPDLPGDNVSIQLNWAVRNFFQEKAQQIGHVTCVTADRGAPARAVGVPLFSNLSPGQGLDVVMGAYAITDPRSNPIVNVLSSDAFKVGVKIARRFNPVFATTVSYIQALTAGVMSRRRNYKLTEWRVGMGAAGHPVVPLIAGDYILLDGRLPSGAGFEDVAWENLTWNAQQERVDYQGQAFKNPYVIIRVEPTPANDREDAATVPTPGQPGQHGRTRRGG